MTVFNSDFSNCNTYKALKQLARTPYDLVENQHEFPERVAIMKSSSACLTLQYSCERVDLACIDALYDLYKESSASEMFSKMVDGEAINAIKGYPSEERSVLHTAMRDFNCVLSNTSKVKSASNAAKIEFEKLGELCEKDEIIGITDVIQVGIGGSDLGPRAVQYALSGASKPIRKAHFVSNVDPDDVHRVLDSVDINTTIAVIVSKSGTTVETKMNEEIIRHAFLKAGIDPSSRCIAVTGIKSPMDTPDNYFESLYMFDYVGGRYSVTSMVGGAIIALTLGISVFKEFLDGAHAMDKEASSSSLAENTPLTAALLGIWNRNFLKSETLAILPYSQALLRFPAHLQQLDMESNGKHIDKFGNDISFNTAPIIWGEPGTNGQHSFYQMLHQGTTIVPIEFIGFKNEQNNESYTSSYGRSQNTLVANLLAQSLSLAHGQDSKNPNKRFYGNRPSSLLVGKELTPFTLGALLAHYEHKVAYQGFIWGINSFDQEGVQLGKVMASSITESINTGKDAESASVRACIDFMKSI